MPDVERPTGIYYSWRGRKQMDAYTRIGAFVDLSAIEANLEAIKTRLSGETKVMAVVKADAYGHGAGPIARHIENKEYLWGFATATMEEALELHEEGIQKPILILGYVYPEDCDRIAEIFETALKEDGSCYGKIRPAVYSLETARKLSQAVQRQSEASGKKIVIPVHIKVDTGMSRIGFQDTWESVAEIQEIAMLPGLQLEGIFTHFARADERDKTSVNRQISRFQSFIENCSQKGIDFPVRHCFNSGGIIDLDGTQWDVVRAGIILYGLYPSDEVHRKRLSLKPAMELKSHIIHIKEISPGTEVSYGGTYQADSVRKIATVPVGYGDGYPRSLSNKGYVLICGKRAPIRGRVCMDQMMVDVTDIPEARMGMEVTLFGEDGGEILPLEVLCDLSGRFNYEFICDINKRVPRIYQTTGRILE